MMMMMICAGEKLIEKKNLSFFFPNAPLPSSYQKLLGAPLLVVGWIFFSPTPDFPANPPTYN